MKILELFFHCYLLKVVVGLHDFGKLPSFDELLRKSIDENVDICSDVTAYACISHERNGQLASKTHYVTEGKLFFQKVAEEILDIESENQLSESENVSPDLRRETIWYSACMGKFQSAEHSLKTLKRTIEKAGNIQDLEATKDSLHWQSVARIYAKEFGFSPFFEVQLYEENVLTIRRPLDTMSLSQMVFRLGPAISKFFSTFGKTKFIKSPINVIKERLNARITKLLNISNDINFQFKNLRVKQFSSRFKSGKHNFDWLQHFRDIGMNVNTDDKFFFETSYFEKLSLFLSELSNNEIVNLIHFMYTMNTKVFFSWDKKSPLSVRSEHCITNMPIQSGIIDKILNEKLSDKYSHLQSMVDNIVAEYKNEIIHSWLDDEKKEIFLKTLRGLKLKITNLKLTSSYNSIVNDYFPVVLNGLENIVNFEKTQIQFKMSRYRRGIMEMNHKDRIKNEGKHLVPKVKYNVPDNLLEIPLIELILPLFDSKFPMSWNYAYFGVAISRELSQIHTILYSLVEKYFEPLQSKKKCFTILQKPVKNEISFDRLIDNYIGLKIAYKALKREIHFFQPETYKMSSLQYNTIKQEFFIAYSAIYCKENNGQNVIVSASNLPSFAKQFSCQTQSPMNPSKKCSFWAKPQWN